MLAKKRNLDEEMQFNRARFSNQKQKNPIPEPTSIWTILLRQIIIRFRRLGFFLVFVLVGLTIFQIRFFFEQIKQTERQNQEQISVLSKQNYELKLKLKETKNEKLKFEKKYLETQKKLELANEKISQSNQQIKLLQIKLKEKEKEKENKIVWNRNPFLQMPFEKKN